MLMRDLFLLHDRVCRVDISRHERVEYDQFARNVEHDANQYLLGVVSRENVIYRGKYGKKKMRLSARERSETAPIRSTSRFDNDKGNYFFADDARG